MTRFTPHRLVNVLIVLFVGIVVAIAAIAKADARPRPLFGFNDSNTAWALGMDEARALGANVARVPMSWDAPPEVFAELDERLEATGIRPLILLWGCWMPDLEAFRAQVSAWTAAYPHAIIQIWNEPNHEAFGDFTPAEAATLARAGVAAAREVRPRGNSIVGPALAPMLNDKRIAPAYRRYMRAVYRPLRRFDVGAAVHLFPYQNAVGRLIRRHVDLASEYGRPWVTEIGFFQGFYKDRQAEVSAFAYRLLERLDVASVIFHRLYPNGVSDQAGGFKSEGCDPPTGAGYVPTSGWEDAARMSVLDNPELAAALCRARKECP